MILLVPCTRSLIAGADMPFPAIRLNGIVVFLFDLLVFIMMAMAHNNGQDRRASSNRGKE